MVTHKGMQAKVRAKLVFRGVQEDKEPRADWPTLAKESLKVRMAIANLCGTTYGIEARRNHIEAEENCL